ncbi:MAG TPA: NAD(P)/FAD-dependent oxidoreductase [Gemmatimonadota bacterium]|nr:NAD(P)/FAD-dependent oxidoreductase [Gemmatimonadota bacterium]
MAKVPTRPRVVVIGAGFGGLQCAKELAGRPVDVLLLDRQNYHLFTPLLYQVASSLLNPSDIAMPVRAVIHGWANVRFRLADVTGVDLDARVVRTADGAEISWDWLVVAAGSRSNFFGLDSVERTAVGLKDLPDAIVIRNQVLSCFETAQWIDDVSARAPLTTFVVAGGGPTGVEYAGALSELLRLALRRDFPELDIGRSRVILVEAAERILGDFPPDLADYAAGELRRRGIEVRTGVAVTGADPSRVELSDGSAIEARTLVWAAGVLPEALAGALAAPRSAGGRIEVAPDLRIPGSERAFAIGDIAAVDQGGAVLPMIAPPAMQEGRHAAANILRAIAGEPMRPFRYRDKGLMATIGRNAGITVKGRVRLKGFLGWVAWLVIHLYYLIGFRNRMTVLFGWVWDYLRFDRPIRIIARGKRPPP